MFSEIAFGVQLDSQQNDHRFTRAFDTVQAACNRRFTQPFWKLVRFFQASADERAIRRETKVMRGFARDVIRAKRRTLASGGAKKLGPDLLSRFLTSAAKRGEVVTDDDLIDIVLNFIIAGRDTTASALSWATMRLMQNGGAAAKLIAEANAQCGDGGSGGGSGGLLALSAEDAFNVCYSQLPYARAVASETLRLHPSVMMDSKVAKAPDTLPDGTPVHERAVMMWSNYVMGRDPTLWDDPLRFSPERWLDGQPDASSSLYKPAAAVSDFKYPVFNAGPRICLGRPLAYLEIQLMLAALWPRFELAAHGDGALSEDYVQSLVSPMKRGLWVTAKKRKV